jgi:hypothetical protein
MVGGEGDLGGLRSRGLGVGRCCCGYFYPYAVDVIQVRGTMVKIESLRP